MSKAKKPFYKRLWFIVIAAVFVLGAIGSLGDDNSSSETPIITEAQTSEANQVVESSTQPETTIAQITETQTKISSEYSNALKKAEMYSTSMHMSKQGLYDQLISPYGENFPADAAQYAIDNIVADWNENALAKADSYANAMYMSKAGVYDQLISEYGEKFTKEEAQYAVDNVVADWNANALAKAKNYQTTMSMSKSAIYDQLISEYGEKFTKSEAQYAIDNLDN